jgi:hypothetical protein
MYVWLNQQYFDNSLTMITRTRELGDDTSNINLEVVTRTFTYVKETAPPILYKVRPRDM